MSAGAFAKIASASATGGGNNIRDGIYKLMVEKVQMQTGHTGECFIAEFRVLDSSPNGAVDEQGRPVIPNAPGSTCSMVCNITKHASAAGNAKAFVEKALEGLGVSPDKINAETMAYVCSENNPLRGLAIIDETYRGVNKGRENPANAGKALTLNKWKAVAQTEADVNTGNAYLDATPPKVDTASAQANSAAALFQQASAQQVAPPPAQNPTPAQPQVAAALGQPAQPAKPAGGGILGGILGGR